MEPEEFDRLYPLLWAWIAQTLNAHRDQARTTASFDFQRLPRYYSNELLEAAKVVEVTELPRPPLRELGLGRFEALNSVEAIGVTYFDTYFVRRDHANLERLHFHELVHLVQWRRLGPEMFLKIYAKGLEEVGYRNSFLKKMAYDLEARFLASPQPFSAEQLIDEALQKARLRA